MSSAERQNRLFRKYFAYFVVLVSGVLVVSGAVALTFSYQETRSTLAAVHREKALSAAIQIEQFLRDIERNIAWTEAPRNRGRYQPAERYVDFLKLLRRAPAITDVSWVDRNGREQIRASRLTMDNVGGGADLANDIRFRSPTPDKPYFSPVYFRKETEPYMTVAIASGTRDGGVTIVDVNLKFVWDVVSRIRVGATGYAYVVNNEGQLVSHPDISLVLQKTSLADLPQVRAALEADDPFLDQNPELIEARDTTGRAMLAAYAPIAPVNWTVLVEQPQREAYAPLIGSLIRNVLLLLLGLVVSVFASLGLARRMVEPIRALQTGAARIGEGELNSRISVSTGDELEALAQDFNNMAAQLQESYADLERKVDERTAELAVANQHKSEFLANMSHELRTPLNAIIGFSQVLREKMFGELNSKQSEYVADIHDSGKHLLSLINDILDLSKIEAGRMELEVSRFSLPETLRNAVTLIRERAARHGIRVNLDVDSQIDIFSGDERKLKQIMLNLLSNAVKFTPDGGQIDIRAVPIGTAIEIAVRDNGIGISADDQEKIFEEFRQVGRSDGRAREGTGLGLPLTRRFVELHGGKLTVESTPGSGSTFRFTLQEQP